MPAGSLNIEPSLETQTGFYRLFGRACLLDSWNTTGLGTQENKGTGQSLISSPLWGSEMLYLPEQERLGIKNEGGGACKERWSAKTNVVPSLVKRRTSVRLNFQWL